MNKHVWQNLVHRRQSDAIFFSFYIRFSYERKGKKNWKNIEILKLISTNKWREHLNEGFSLEIDVNNGDLELPTVSKENLSLRCSLHLFAEMSFKISILMNFVSSFFLCSHS